MHFSYGHEGLMSLLDKGNRCVPLEKLMSIDMLIIQLSLIAAENMSFLILAEMCTIVTVSAR